MNNKNQKEQLITNNSDHEDIVLKESIERIMDSIRKEYKSYEEREKVLTAFRKFHQYLEYEVMIQNEIKVPQGLDEEDMLECEDYTDFRHKVKVDY